MESMELQTSNGQRPGELLRMVSINEDIKVVMRIAKEINLTAINAMLISNKIGSSGFGVVSSELRIFSRRLNEVMHSLLECVSMLVREVAGMIRLDKAMQVQQATQARAPHYTYWDAMRMRKASELKRNHASVECFRLKLALAVNKANKLCVMGRSLSYSAKVEAVYGGEQANALKQVSEQVEGAICGILGTLAKLDRQLGMAA